MTLRLRVLLGLGCWLAWSGDAAAQLTSIDKPAISVERLWLSPGPGGFVGGQDAQVLDPGDYSLAVLGSLMSRPIVFSDLESGEPVSVPVKLRLGYEVAMARGMTPRIQLGVAIPVVAAQHGDRLRGIGLSEAELAPVATADVRLHGKLRLQPEADAAFGYGVSVYVALPTGNERHFAGERGTLVSWTLVTSYRGAGWRIAANLALRLRTDEVVLLSPARPHGNEIIGTLAGEYALPSRWKIPLGVVAEVSSVQGDGDGASPGEIRAGLVAHLLANARIKVIAGGGYTPDEVGAPAWRVALVFDRSRP